MTAVIVLQLVLYLSASIGAEAIVITMILVLGSKLILGMDKIIGVLDIDTQSIDQAYTLIPLEAVEEIKMMWSARFD